MNTIPSFLTSLLTKLPNPPDWLIAEGQNRIVLLLNHVLQQEPEAMQRLSRQKGQVSRFAWQQFDMYLTATPVGLLSVAPKDAKVDLLLEVTDKDLAELGQKVMRREKPNVRIEGNIQLAAEVQWLVQNVKWDLEDDLARIVGHVPAHRAINIARAVKTKLSEWLAK